jgi:hypothetical protein
MFSGYWRPRPAHMEMTVIDGTIERGYKFALPDLAGYGISGGRSVSDWEK